MENKEFKTLISKFYDLDTESKKKEIYAELEKIKKMLDIVLQFDNNPTSNDLITYNSQNVDSENDNLVKIYHNILIIQESLITYFKDIGY